MVRSKRTAKRKYARKKRAIRKRYRKARRTFRRRFIRKPLMKRPIFCNPQEKTGIFSYTSRHMYTVPSDATDTILHLRTFKMNSLYDPDDSVFEGEHVRGYNLAASLYGRYQVTMSKLKITLLSVRHTSGKWVPPFAMFLYHGHDSPSTTTETFGSLHAQQDCKYVLIEPSGNAQPVAYGPRKYFKTLSAVYNMKKWFKGATYDIVHGSGAHFNASPLVNSFFRIYAAPCVPYDVTLNALDWQNLQITYMAELRFVAKLTEPYALFKSQTEGGVE